METFEFVSAVRGYHIYKDIGEPSVGEKLIAHREFGNHAQRRTNSGPSTARILENSVVLLFEKSDHKLFKRPVNKEGVTARNVSLK
ncbi:unnamed protein product [Pocillopora meandrina]|uniref:Uncharacterized protein n=1 Tax=Pocillopora meandrina TaxID=46732 RepID=A0AAU9VJX3_9CNID|nr:unnamed protein product [Pocillopora meandrina]